MEVIRSGPFTKQSYFDFQKIEANVRTLITTNAKYFYYYYIHVFADQMLYLSFFGNIIVI
jgi:hypothetical protein